MKKIKKPKIKDVSSGLEEIKKNTESSGTNGIAMLKTVNGNNNSLVELGIGRSMGLRDHLENLREASSGSMNLLDSTTGHLYELLKKISQSETVPKTINEWQYENILMVKQTVDVAKQLHTSMKLKLDTVKVLHKIAKDVSDSIKGKD